MNLEVELVMLQGLNILVENTITEYFNSKDEDERKDNWNKLMAYFQLYMYKPNLVKFRIIKSKEESYTILIFKNIENDSKVLIPMIANRKIKLNLEDFIRVGLAPDVLNILVFEGRTFELYEDRVKRKRIA